MKRILLFTSIVMLFFGIITPTIFAISINSTSAEGLIAYAETGIQTPRYRLWNDTSKNYTAELTNTNTNGGNMQWIVTKANHERDEIIVGAEDTVNDVNIQIVNGTKNWTNPLEVSINVPNAATRGFDIAIEDISGEVLIVYENDTIADSRLRYRIWNGSEYSAEQNISTNITGPSNWVSLIPKEGTDEMMLLAVNATQGALWAIPWNGTDFLAARNMTLATTTVSATTQHFTFAWEERSGDGIVGYGTGNSVTFRNYTQTTGTWSAEFETIALGQALNGLRFCSDPNSDYIGIMIFDAGSDVNVRMWNGSRMLPNPPTEDAATEINGANNLNVDCKWERGSGDRALFGFIDANVLFMDYFFFNRANESFSTTSLLTTPTTAAFGSDDIAAFRFTEHPTTNEIMVVAEDILEDLTVHLWNGTDFVSIIPNVMETTTQTANGAQESAMFDWERFDPVPVVLNLTINNSAVQNFNEAINFTVNVTDNVGINIVEVNITKPTGNVTTTRLTNVGSIYNLTFAGTNETGTYTIRVIANDTSRHNNINATQTLTFNVGDTTKPIVLNLTVNATAISQNERINISANVTDNSRIDTVLVNITIPGLTIFDQYRMTNVSNALSSIFNFTFANTSRTGTYTARIIANDTSGNINDTQIITFTVGDAIAPNVTQLQVNQTVLRVSETLNFTVNVTDNILVDTVLVNISVPNTSGFDQYKLTNITGGSLTSIFNLTFANTSRKGGYQIRVIANDTSGNRNITETINFSVGDTINPSLTITAPVDRFNTSGEGVSFQFTPTDNSFSTIACNLSVDAVLNNSNTTVVNNTLTTFESTGFAEGNHNWNITCADGDGNQNTSTTRIFTVDTSAPVLNALTNDPSTTDTLDPGRRIAFFANVTDNLTAVNVVRLQHKLSTGSDFTNVTMTLNNSNGLYEAAFTPTESGTYNVRVFSTDIVSNQGQSVVVNLSVQNEATWTRTPASVAVGATPNQVVSFANVTLNNTGDVSLNFTMSSTFTATTFNTTFPVVLSPGESRVVEVNVTAPSTTGATQFQIVVSASPNANPASQNISGTLAVTEGQPFLAATFTEIPTSKTKGDTFSISGQIKNIGTGNATNTSIYFTIPTDWTVTGGDLNSTTGDLDVGSDAVERTITVNIPSNATDGLRTAKVNASGLNFSNSSLEALNLLSGDERTINVSNVTILAAGPVSVPAVTAPAAAPAQIPSAIPSAQLGSIAGKLTPGIDKKVLETYETIYVVRGENTTFPLNITNIYNETELKEVEMDIEGYLAQYLSWQPKKMDNLSFAQTEQFIVTVAAPGYKEREEYNLTVTVTGTLEATVIDKIYNKKTKTYDLIKRVDKTKLIETRHVTLIILETSVLEAVEKQKQAETYLEVFKEKGIGTTKLEALIAALNTAYASEQFAEVETISQEIEVFATMVLETDEILNEVRERYTTLEAQGYNVEEWNGLITLAEMAFAEENFDSAYVRAKEAQLYQAIAVEQQFNLGAFFNEYWQELISAALVACVVGYFTQRRIFLLTVSKQLAQLDAREQQTEILKEDAQRECFTLKKISTLTYHKRMYQYELLIDTIRKKRYELQKKKERLLTGEEMLLFLRRDSAQVIEQIKILQDMYYNKGSIPKSQYLQKREFYRNRLVQNEKESTIIETTLAEEKMLESELKQRVTEKTHILFGQQMKKPPMQNIGEFLVDAATYAFIVTKHTVKWCLFRTKELYDLSLLNIIERKGEISIKRKEVQDDLAVRKELLEMVAEERMQKTKSVQIHPWHLREIAQRMRHGRDASVVAFSWFLKKKKTEVSQYLEKHWTQKQWSWKGLYQHISYRSYFLFEQWKWRCKEFFLQVRS